MNSGEESRDGTYRQLKYLALSQQRLRDTFTHFHKGFVRGKLKEGSLSHKMHVGFLGGYIMLIFCTNKKWKRAGGGGGAKLLYTNWGGKKGGLTGVK